MGAKHLLRSARELFDDLADRVEDADVRQVSPSDFDHLYDNDNRKTYTYLAPKVVSLDYVVQLELNQMALESELKKQHKDYTGAVGDEGGSAEPTQLNVVKRAGEIVHRDIKRSRLQNGKRDTLRYMREQFPRSLLTLLAYCIGKGHLVAEETGINGETPVEDKPWGTDELEGGSTDAVRVYFWGTAIARAVLGSLYFPPHSHYLKLFQVFKVRIHYV